MFKLTVKTLWSHKRRLIGTFAAVALGVAFLSGTLVLATRCGPTSTSSSPGPTPASTPSSARPTA